MFQIGEEYHGFKLVKKYNIEDIESEAYVFDHTKSGGRLLHIKNKDENKVFSIGFKTPPYNNKGAAHIVEHSVLHGSRKYNTKAPFMDMATGSMNTFLNASTHNDKTVYPVASLNEKDLMNLMDVYLDGVFFPKFLQNPEIFYQEGWRYHLESEDKPLEIRGVVFNEMIGTFSNPNALIARGINESLYPDSTYRYSSGGVPKDIIELKYEEVKEFYSRYYHPSNSYMYLYGNMDLEKFLKGINENYLSFFHKKDLDTDIKFQLEKPSSQRKEKVYASFGETVRDYVSINYLIDHEQSTEEFIALKILNHILVESPNGIMKKEILQEGLGENVILFDGDGPQPSVSFVVQNTSRDNVEKIEGKVCDLFKKIFREGFQLQLVESCINIVDYNFREAGGYSTKGIMYNLMTLDTWMYGKSETEYLNYIEVFENIRGKVKERYFENLIYKYFIENEMKSTVVLLDTKNEEDTSLFSIKKYLEKTKKNLSSEEISNLIQKTIDFEIWQNREISAKDREAIPELALDEVNKSVEEIPQDIHTIGGVKVLNHKLFTQGICYIEYWFDVAHITMDEVYYMALIRDILGEIDTSNYKSHEFVNEMLCKTGGINGELYSYGDFKNHEKYYPKYKICGKTFARNIEDLNVLVNEMVTGAKFSDRQKIYNIILKSKSRMETNIFMRAVNILSKRVALSYSDAAMFTDKTGGFEYYWFLIDIIQNFEENIEGVIHKLKEVYLKMFTLDNLIVNFTGDEEDFLQFKGVFQKALKGLSFKNHQQDYNFSISKDNYTSEGIVMGADIQFVSMGYNIKNLKHDYSGKIRVLENILNGKYLHEKVREKGGAYGCRAIFAKNGNMSFISFRDPNIGNTLKVYEGIPEFLENLNINSKELDRFKIGALNSVSRAYTSKMKGEVAGAYNVCNISIEDLSKERSEIFNTSIEDIRNFAGMMKDFFDNANICVLGNHTKVLEHREIFHSLVSFTGTKI